MPIKKRLTVDPAVVWQRARELFDREVGACGLDIRIGYWNLADDKTKETWYAKAREELS